MENKIKEFIKKYNLPEITGKSDKQIAYAESLRNKYILQVYGTEGDPNQPILDDALAIVALTPDVIAEYAKESGMEVDEYFDVLLGTYYCRKMYAVLTTGDARTLIDTLR